MNAPDAIQALEQATQKQEKEIVVDLGIDRILHYVGVYVMILLAVAAKITEVVGSKLSCYPARNATPKSGFIAYSEFYCWETSQLTSNGINSSCNLQDFGVREEVLMKDPASYKTFIQWLPYVMIMEAFLFSIPTVWWHFRVGARLMGHLKFMQILLNDVYEKVKRIPTGIYRKEDAYDRKGYYLDGWSQYEDDYKLEDYRIRRKREKEAENRRQSKSDVVEVLCCTRTSTTNRSTTEEQDTTNKKKPTIETSFLYGDIQDRHLFSMLCFENFASLEQLPYILSVYKLTMKREKTIYLAFDGPITRCILRLVCHEKTFSERFLVANYFGKHICGCVASLVSFVATIAVFSVLWSDLWTSESFQCDVIYHEQECMICTMLRKRDMLAFLIINILLTLLYIGLSLWHLIFIRRSANRAHSKYFEEMADTGSVALSTYDDGTVET